MIEVEPALKNRLHAHVALEGRTLKEWFVERAQDYLARTGEELQRELLDDPTDKTNAESGDAATEAT